MIELEFAEPVVVKPDNEETKPAYETESAVIEVVCVFTREVKAVKEVDKEPTEVDTAVVEAPKLVNVAVTVVNEVPTTEVSAGVKPKAVVTSLEEIVPDTPPLAKVTQEKLEPS